MDDDSLRADLQSISSSVSLRRGTGRPEDCLIAPPQKALEKFLGISLDPEVYRSLAESKKNGLVPAPSQEIPAPVSEVPGPLSEVPGPLSEVPAPLSAPPHEDPAPLNDVPANPDPLQKPPADDTSCGLGSLIPDPTPKKDMPKPPLSPGSPGVETRLVL